MQVDLRFGCYLFENPIPILRKSSYFHAFGWQSRGIGCIACKHNELEQWLSLWRCCDTIDPCIYQSISHISIFVLRAFLRAAFILGFSFQIIHYVGRGWGGIRSWECTVIFHLLWHFDLDVYGVRLACHQKAMLLEEGGASCGDMTMTCFWNLSKARLYI